MLQSTGRKGIGDYELQGPNKKVQDWRPVICVHGYRHKGPCNVGSGKKKGARYEIANPDRRSFVFAKQEVHKARPQMRIIRCSKRETKKACEDRPVDGQLLRTKDGCLKELPPNHICHQQASDGSIGCSRRYRLAQAK